MLLNSDSEGQDEFRRLDRALDPFERWFTYCLVFLGIGIAIGLSSYFLLGPNWNSVGLLFLGVMFSLAGAAVSLLVMLFHPVRYVGLRLNFIGSRLRAHENPFPLYWQRPYRPRIVLLIVVALGIVPAIYFRYHAPELFLLLLGFVFLLGVRLRSFF